MVKHKRLLIGLLVAIFSTTAFAASYTYYQNQIKLYQHKIDLSKKVIAREQKKVIASQKIIEREQKKLNIARKKMMAEESKVTNYYKKIENLRKKRDKEYPPKETKTNFYNPLGIRNERDYKLQQRYDVNKLAWQRYRNQVYEEKRLRDNRRYGPRFWYRYHPTYKK